MSQAPGGALPPITSTKQAMQQHPAKYGGDTPVRESQAPAPTTTPTSGRLTFGELTRIAEGAKPKPVRPVVVESAIHTEDPAHGIRLAARGLAGLTGGGH